MAKQIKIGYDVVPAPVTKQFPQLKDIFGSDLVDIAGNPLVTEEDGVLGVFGRADGSISTHINNNAEAQVYYRPKGGIQEANTGGDYIESILPGTVTATQGSNVLIYEDAISPTSNATPVPLDEAYEDVRYIFIGNDVYEVTGIDANQNEISLATPFIRESREGYFVREATRITDDPLPVPVVEQFPGESEVSTTLLGIPRAEEQLSLFSDVAVYGLDIDNWNHYSFDDGRPSPEEWRRKENPIFGRRTRPRFEEATEEQALFLYSFPSQYDWPGLAQEFEDFEISDSFREYLNFIAFGKYLYSIYIEEYPVFARKNFLDDSITVMNDSIEESVESRKIDIGPASYSTATDPAQIIGNQNFFDIDYGDDPQDSMDQIERWTAFWQQIKDGVAVFPQLDSKPVPFNTSPEVISYRAFVQNSTAAGGSPRVERFAIIESQQSFRYQPGRVSGFTYGIRFKTDLRTEDNIIEWGVSNDTDEYMFQVRGTKLNIVRRSTLSLFESEGAQSSINENLIERLGFNDVEDEELVFPLKLKNDERVQGPRNEKFGTHYELVIPREKWNGDPLNGSGRSGYNIGFEQVTMYKIEFSWYGAVGAKFYAYIPSEIGEARWVLMHTLVIENGLGQPCLVNPDFKFKYFIYSLNNENLIEPGYVYKYGSSYYIDGGDEGTIRLTSETVDEKDFTQRTPVLGILPKERILNSEGTSLTNYKKAYPNQLTVTSSEACRIDVEEIIGSPDGQHFYYAPGLKTDDSASRDATLRISSTGRQIEFANDSISWEESDDGAHIIADGIYGVYVGYDSGYSAGGNGQIANLFRKNGSFDEPTQGEIQPFTIKNDGTILQPKNGDTFEAKITNFDSVAASSVPITTNEFKIHFLNPRPTGPDGRHSSDFRIGVTDKAPVIDSGDGSLKFDDGSGNLSPIDYNEVLYATWSNSNVLLDFKSREEREYEPYYGDRFWIDARLPRPAGQNSGNISTLAGNISLLEFPIDRIVQETEGPYTGDYKVFFSGTAPGIEPLPGSTQSPQQSLENYTEVGVAGQGLGIFYTSVVGIDSATQESFAYVDGDIEAAALALGIDTVNSIQSKQLEIKDDFKAVSYDEDGSNKFPILEFSFKRLVKFNTLPLYPFIAMCDNCTVNNIVIEEITPVSSFCKTPIWLYDANGAISPTDPPSLGQGVSQQSDQFLPSSFNSNDRLSGTRFDSFTQQPLRPGTVVYSFYVDANETTKIDLSNIFNPDRKTSSRGLLNNKAYFFTASSIDDSIAGGTVEMALTVKEQ